MAEVCKYCGRVVRSRSALVMHENSCKLKQGDKKADEKSGGDCNHEKRRLLDLNDAYEKAIYQHENGRVKYVCLECEEVF